MKTTLLVICLLLTTAAFGQVLGSSRSAEPQIYMAPEHPQHASYSAIAHEQTLVAGGGFTYAHGDRPASDFPQPAEVSLGEIARELRKEHETAKKARIIWNKP